MIRAGLQPNLVTFVSIIPSCENSNSLWFGESLHACVIKHGSGYQLPMLTALVSMYSKLGDVNSAYILFDQMSNRNLLSWNSMVSGYVHDGQWYASLATFCECSLRDAIQMQSPLLVFFLPAPSYRLFCWASLPMRLVLESNLPQALT